MNYNYYGNDVIVSPIDKKYAKVSSPQVMYDMMKDIWCVYSCAPRYRDEWSEDNMTLGQCSITSFLVQDIFGGEVFGVPLPDGGYHCYNVVDGKKFDLTSEQFGNTVLIYDEKHPQSREEHFASQEKYDRYKFIKAELEKKIK